jgi:hypothetical protein
MAPRNAEQQAAYNETRRKNTAEAKARKDAADASVKAVKAERKAAKLKGSPKATAKVIVEKKGRIAPPPKPTLDQRAKAAVADKRLTGALKVHGATEAEAKAVVETRRVGKSPALAAPYTTKAAKKMVATPERDDDDPPPLAVPEKRDPKASKPVGPGGPSTIARSYQREFKGSGATKRGNMLQVTVTFTEAQFLTLKQRAEVYQCSLAEVIRKCVLAGPLSVSPTSTEPS